jgi:hypothetical protein
MGILPPQGLSEARRGTKVSDFFSHLSHLQGVPLRVSLFIPLAKDGQFARISNNIRFSKEIKKSDPSGRFSPLSLLYAPIITRKSPDRNTS